jgi:hypothetical protein
MTQEEKAKAYDKALERARLSRLQLLDIGEEATEIEYIFPELKGESEDERIRKEMIFYFTEEIPQCSIQEHSDKMREFISWLKRQEVERTKLELKAGSSYFCYKSRWERADSETFKKGLIYMCNKDGVLDNFVIKNPEQHFIEIKDERIAWLEKQGEHNKNHKTMIVKFICKKDWHGIGDYYYGKIYNGYPCEKEQKGYDIYDDNHVPTFCDEDFINEYFNIVTEEKQDEQKSAEWSEEDSTRLQRIIDFLWYNRKGDTDTIYQQEQDINWLKSLKQRIGE